MIAPVYGLRCSHKATSRKRFYKRPDGPRNLAVHSDGIVGENRDVLVVDQEALFTAQQLISSTFAPAFLQFHPLHYYYYKSYIESTR